VDTVNEQDQLNQIQDPFFPFAMTPRRTFLHTTAAAAAGFMAAPLLASNANPLQQHSPDSLPTNPDGNGRYRPASRFGLGGVALGNGFAPASEDELLGAVDQAWSEGVRFFDTSPWYGLGLSERRLGVFLQNRPRDEYVISTKIGRLLTPKSSQQGKEVGIWKNIPPFDYKYDYTAAGTRRSIEDSLQRLGLARIDIVFIHDLSPDNEDMKEDWTDYFEIARNGAMPELTRMREEGLIKAWGMGVNEIEPARRSFEEADPDIVLLATQYSLIKHEDPLHTFFPKVKEAGASIVVGAPLKAGFLAGRHRYLYDGDMPSGILEKRARLSRLAHDHGIDLLTASLQFCNAPEVVSSVIPGARTAQQVRQNAAAMRAEVPEEFWQALRKEGLIAENAPVPRSTGATGS
jgi:D-threo-aldose 1-dehydrogenase